MENQLGSKNLLKRMVARTSSIRFNFNITPSRSRENQLRMLRKLLRKAEHTEYGFAHHFTEILESKDTYASFSQKIQAGDYLHMLPYWKKAREGKENVTWPGKMEYFALSSGTSDGSSKFIPVSKDMLKYIRRASLRQVLYIAATDVPKDHITKNWLMIGGSTALDFNGVYYSGDLSGITTGNIPNIFQRMSKPEPDIRSSKNWQEKIEKITLEAQNWDVGMIAGVPAWIQLLFENIIDHYQLKNIHEIWPNLEVYIHGGVSIKPYKKSLDKLLGREIKYFETYLASEGFIAFQSRQNSDGGMRLLLRGGIFYEFVPFTKENFSDSGVMVENPKALPIWEVQENVEYALLLTTCSGAWRYLIGDTIKFTNLRKNEIAITGRTKHFISLCGEHLSVDNMTDAVTALGEKYDTVFNEFTMGGMSIGAQFGHQWYLASDRKDLDIEELAEDLDALLADLNDDYAVERKHALKEVRVILVDSSLFVKWLETRGKLGAQSKFPRVIKGELFANWQDYLLQQGAIKGLITNV